MAKDDLKKASDEELDSRMKEARATLIKLNSQKSAGAGLKNPDQLRKAKKSIARILTIKKQRSIAIKQ